MDQNIHVKLQCNGAQVPLPKWFTSGRDAKLIRFYMLDDFSAYIESFTPLNQSSTVLEVAIEGKLPSLGLASILIIFVALFFTASIYFASMLSPTTATLPSSFFFSLEETQQQRCSRNES